MATNTKRIEEMVLARVMRLNAMVHGVVAGILLGLAIFIATNWLVLKGGKVVGPRLALLGQFFMGYKVTFAGSTIGFGYGFVCGFLTGYLVASRYNGLVHFRENSRNSG